MSINVKSFARSDIKSERIHNDDSDDEDISYLPQPTQGRRQSEQHSPPQYDSVPRFRDEKPMFGPRDADGSITVRYPSTIDGYANDDEEFAEMQKLGLPIGFSYSHSAAAVTKQKKGDKKTFYCEICLIELNSLDTMKSHVSGVKHMKKQLALESQREEKLRKGEISENEKIPQVIPIPNPENTKKKVPMRLHEKIRESMEPIVGLDFVKEWIPVSDPEMEPHYECSLCGNKGIANGMFSHIVGYKHRQAFVEELYKDDPNVLDLSQRDLLSYARKNAENSMDLSVKIKCRRSDEEYPWPAGKAPWSIERGGTGIAPDRARENWSRNNDFQEDEKPVIIRATTSGRSHASRVGLPSPKDLKPPKDESEALRMIELAHRMLQYGVEFVGPRLSSDEATVLKTTKDAIVTKILFKRDIPIPSSMSNGHHSQSRRGSSISMNSSSSSHRRPVNNSRSPSPSPPTKRERRSPSNAYNDRNREASYNGWRDSSRDSHSYDRSSDRRYEYDSQSHGRERSTSSHSHRESQLYERRRY